MKKLLIVSSVVALFASSMFAADGATIYKKCIACHGAKAEKVFNNKVPALTSLDAAAIVASLQDYKAGKANKFGMGAMMKPIATPLSEDDAKAVAGYIQTLK
ncbi:c-type cytochrome [Campylobacter sp. RM9344]|uniref:C-type cytochrome n=1 Tax=Campylobacter californiensis TaxID=1032243 RepID=A0AAW3ZRK3_9BACT|nr:MULTISPECIES: c-type cytochrome [unclassified Campylobacter]MBE2984009.1 c-type cytochrome [Campylobacter sp. RM6883]MBE2994547.1 c-type cytochrome [Campylobacter sp. RM6913]MBE3030068.1 c-type cytochrome [Campylobacter sp. RM9344]MBE3607744.1 c-type cytochrome [Campylobacter sp. RM9337]QCD51136.1 periplasmic monoheme cytochrome c553 [Campylobacter sp. RM6914]